MSNNNKTTIKKLIEEVWNKKNSALIDEIIAPDYVNNNPEGVLSGVLGYHQFYDTYTNAFPDCTIKVTDLVAEGDSVVCRYVFKGTHKGELMGIKPTNNLISVVGMVIANLEEGKVTEEKIVWDTLSLMQQLEAIPQIHHNT